MSLQAYIEESRLRDLTPYERTQHMPALFKVYLEKPENQQYKYAYENGAEDVQAKIYAGFDSAVREKYADVFQVEASKAKPMKIKTRSGSILEGDAAESYASLMTKPAPQAPSTASGMMTPPPVHRPFEVVQEKRDPIMRPLMDEQSELIVAGVNDDIIKPSELDDDQLQTILPFVRRYTPDKADAFVNEERKRLKQLGVSQNSFIAKSAIRGASPADALTDKLDEWMGDPETSAKYRRWQQAYPTQASTSSTAGTVGGLMSGGLAASSLAKGILKPGWVSTVGQLGAMGGVDYIYGDKLPGISTEMLGLDPDSASGRTVTALEGLALTGALSVPSLAKKLKGAKWSDVVSGKIPEIPPEKLAEARRKLTEMDPVTGKRKPVEAPNQPLRDKFKESYENVRTTLQDPWYRIRKLNEEMGVDVDADFYNAVRREQGITSNQVQVMSEDMGNVLKGIADTESQLGFRNGELMRATSDYLAARHAPDFNRHVRNSVLEEAKRLNKVIASSDGAVRESAMESLNELQKTNKLVLEGRASGLSNQEAKAAIQNIESNELFPQVKQFADELSRIHSQTLDVLRDGGLISATKHAELRKSMPNHVPFQRIMDDMDIDDYFAGTGLDAGRNVNNSGLMKAKGSERQINDIAENIYAGLRGAIGRANRNLSNQKLLEFSARHDPAGELINVTKRRQGNGDVSVFVDGERKFVSFKDPNLQKAAAYMPSSVRPWYVKAGLFTNRVLGRMYTGYNPDFLLPNKLRDLQDGVLNMWRMGDFKGAVGVAKSAVADSLAIYDHAFRGGQSEGAKLYQEMIEQGGSTGGLSHMVFNSTDESFASLAGRSHSSMREKWHTFNAFVDKVNMIMEDSTRLGAYRAAKKSGKSQAEAALIARDISFDPMLKGTSGDVMQASYLFFNPALQSARNVMKTLSDPKKLSAVGATVTGISYAIDQHNQAITGDPEYRNKLGGFEKDRAFTIIYDVNNDPNADTKYKSFSFPVSYGLMPVKVYSDAIVDLLNGRSTDPLELAQRTAASLINSTNPLGGNDLLSSLTPTNVGGIPLDVVAEIARNQTGLGNAIRPPHEELNNPRDYSKFFDYTATTKEGQVAIDTARLLYNKFNLDWSPENMLHVYRTVTGGPGETFKNAMTAASAIATGEDLDSRNIPIVRRFFRKTSRESAEYRENVDTELGEVARDERTRLTLLHKRGRAIASDMVDILKQDPTQLGSYVRSLPEEERLDPEMWSYVMRRVERIAQDVPHSSQLINNNFGVENGARAKLYYKMLSEMPEADRSKFLEREAKAGNLNQTVAKQLTMMMQQGQK